MANKGDDSFIKKKPMTKAELEETLLNNFVNLQGVLTNLSIKFDDLSNNLSTFLKLFEVSAKSFAEKQGSNLGRPREDKELLNKLDSLLDQNKTIAKGIMMMEDKIKGRGPSIKDSQEPPNKTNFQKNPRDYQKSGNDQTNRIDSDRINRNENQITREINTPPLPSPQDSIYSEPPQDTNFSDKDNIANSNQNQRLMKSKPLPR